MLALLASAWTWLPGAPWVWTLAVLAVIGFPIYPQLLRGSEGPRPQQPVGVFLRDMGEEFETAAAQVLLDDHAARLPRLRDGRTRSRSRWCG